MTISKNACLVSAVLALRLTAFAATPPGTLVEKIVAKVNGQLILQSELAAAHQQYLRQAGQAPPDIKGRLLATLVMNKMLLAKAKQEGIVVTDKEVAPALQQKMQELTTQASSAAALAQQWSSPVEEIKKEVNKKLKEQLQLDRMRRQVVQDIATTPKEVSAFFKTLCEKDAPYLPAEVIVRQIVYYPQSNSQEGLGAAKAALAQLRAKLLAGHLTFAQAAKEHSEDKATAPNGGLLAGVDGSSRAVDELPPEVYFFIEPLSPGAITAPVTFTTAGGQQAVRL